MKYKFPKIENFSDVESSVGELFIVAEKEGYKVVNYIISTEDTFPPLDNPPYYCGMDAELDYIKMVKREFRGLTFCSETGKILRRPYHKFFNLGQREDVMPDKIDWTQPYIILEKLDGSMIVPFKVKDKLIWGTKMGDTDVSKPVEEYIAKVENYRRYLVPVTQYLSMDKSLIFEWCSRQQRIVIDYPKEELVLTAIRDNVSGEYMPYLEMKKMADWFGIPCVKAIESTQSPEELVEFVRTQEGAEGVVLRFDDGHMLKLKGEWYCQIHAVKSDIAIEKNLVRCILEDKLDDLKPFLLPEDVIAVETFERELYFAINVLAVNIGFELNHLRRKECCVTKKDFALNHVKRYPKWIHQFIFRYVEDEEKEAELSQDLIRYTLEHTGRICVWKEFKETILLEAPEWLPHQSQEVLDDA